MITMTRFPTFRLQLLVLLLLTTAAPTRTHADDLKPGDNLVVEGIPPIPTELVERVNHYTEFRSASPLSWHPKRREMLISTRFAETSQIHIVKAPGGARTQLTFFDNRVGNASYQPTHGDYFVFSMDVGGNEFAQLHRYDFSTGESTLLTDGTSKNRMGPWSRDGQWLAYTSTRRNKTDTDIYVINPADKATDRMVAEVKGGGWFPLDFSPDGAALLVMEYVSANESYLWRFEIETGEKTQLTPRPPDGDERISYGDGEFAPEGQSIYVTTDRDSQFRRLARVELETKQHTYLTTPISWDVDGFTLSDDGKTIALVTNENGIHRLRLFDTASGDERLVSDVPPGGIGSLEWHPNSRELMFGVSWARSPFDAWSLDTTTGKLDRWTESETGGLNAAQFVEPELVTWSSFDGRDISGFLYRPPAEKFPGKRPVMIYIHGGPEGQSQPGFLGRMNYHLNELGVAILYPNVRGSTGYGKEFVKLDNGLKREDAVKDIGALLDWIAKQPDLNPDRVLVTGGSYGGFLTLSVAATYPQRIRCAIDIVGMSNLVTFLQNTESYRRDLRRAEYGDERIDEIREFMNRIAPLNNADRITKPLMVVQGRNDPRVPHTEARQIVETVRKNGTPVWFLMANDEGHGFAKKRNADYQFYATVLFMQQFLLNE